MTDKETRIGGLVLAAGLSSRMKDFKPLMMFRGKTVIENTVDSMIAGGASKIVVVTGFRGEELERLISEKYGDNVITVCNEEFGTKDMMHSVKIGCGRLKDCRAFFLLPGDMPVVSETTFEKLLECRKMHECELEDNLYAVFPTVCGARKHPPLIGSGFIGRIESFAGEGGLRELFSQNEELILTVPVDDEGVCIDLDTQEDFLTVRSRYE